MNKRRRELLAVADINTSGDKAQLGPTNPVQVMAIHIELREGSLAT